VSETTSPSVISSRPRRRAGDRRRPPTPLLSQYTLRGRRRRIRREADLQRGRYVDRSDGAHLALVLLLLTFISIDAASTLFILENGGTEVNPLMVRTIERGVGWFVLVKIGPLPLAFLLLSVHRYFRWVRVALGMLVAIYGTLTLYHATLIVRILS
jgi:hypothetical protein